MPDQVAFSKNRHSFSVLTPCLLIKHSVESAFYGDTLVLMIAPRYRFETFFDARK